MAPWLSDDAAELARRARWAALAAVAVGTLVALLMSAWGADREHWDHPLYWPTVYPLLCAGSAVLGLWSPRRAWLPGLLVMLAQALPLLVRYGAQGELVGLSLVVLTVISLPPMLGGVVGAVIRRRSLEQRGKP